MPVSQFTLNYNLNDQVEFIWTFVKIYLIPSGYALIPF
jgi:hypothetical protein